MAYSTNIIKLYTVRIIHFLVLLFVFVIPFTNNKELLLLHFITIPFIYFHWITNNDVCCLTETEKFIRIKMGEKEDDCFTCKIISPIYNLQSSIDNKFASTVIYLLSYILWSITVLKLYNKVNNNEITSFNDFLLK